MIYNLVKQSKVWFFIILMVAGWFSVIFSSTYFVAEAARTGLSVVVQGDDFAEVDTLLPLKVVLSDDGFEKPAATVELSDGGLGGVFTNGNLSGGCSSVLAGDPATLSVSTNGVNKAFCYSNATAGVYTLEAQLVVAGEPVGAVGMIEISVQDSTVVPEPASTVTLCKADETGEMLADWQLSLAQESIVSDFSGTTTADGCVVFDEVPYGDYVVGEIMQPNWSNVSGLGDTITVDAETEQFTLVNKYQAPAVPTYRIDGHKYQADGLSTTTKAGWLIRLEDNDGAVLATTTTDAEGYYQFEVEAGSYEVHEALVAGWEQLSVMQGENWVETESIVESCQFTIATDDYRCDFYNRLVITDENDEDEDEVEVDNDEDQEEVEKPSKEIKEIKEKRKSSYGTKVKKHTPRVLGISTTNTCPLIKEYTQKGWENNPLEVKKLQSFLNTFKDTFGGTENPVTGYFGETTDANVRAFQEHYRSEILDPWSDDKTSLHIRANGFVYKTTALKINNIVCSDNH